ncbi:MAG: 50S ribosomal protein L4 [candidate division KSB1 bacterium]|nr:50S ribosomal protein L4 [candidate division KSB1 bacterium]MDZ7339987.1 50S ribosomal protein L4 [candidate division KSB1 bacterium]
MKLEVYKIDGVASGKSVALPKEVFDVTPNDHMIYQDVRRIMTNRRQGTAASKNRAMVRGGGKKPWRQKGRGTARAGTTRSPIWVGGGRVFGPQPRDFEMKLTKKMKRLARVSAYTHKAKDAKVVLVEDFKLEEPKTRAVFQMLKNLKLQDQKVLLLTSDYDPVLLRAGRNIPNLIIRQATDATTYDILNCETLLIQQQAIEKITEVCAA